MGPRKKLLKSGQLDPGSSDRVDVILIKAPLSTGTQPLFAVSNAHNSAARSATPGMPTVYHAPHEPGELTQAEPPYDSTEHRPCHEWSRSNISMHGPLPWDHTDSSRAGTDLATQPPYPLGTSRSGFQPLDVSVSPDSPVFEMAKTTTKLPENLPIRLQAKRTGIKVEPGRHRFRHRVPSAVQDATRRLRASSKINSLNITNPLGTLQIHETEDVTTCMKADLLHLHQHPCKKIAKIWIKAICPKKQSRYPYQQKRRKRNAPDALNASSTGPLRPSSPPVVPGFWPDTGTCRFREPDHVNRIERVALLMHFIRLRPDRQTLLEWNDGLSETDETLACQSWAEYLWSLVPPSALVESGRESKKKQQERLDTFKKLFKVAQAEEDYERGGRDGTTSISWDPVAAHRIIAHKEKVSKRLIVRPLDADTATAADTPNMGRKRKRELKEEIDSVDTEGIAASPDDRAMRRTGSTSTVADMSSGPEHASQPSFGSVSAASSTTEYEDRHSYNFAVPSRPFSSIQSGFQSFVPYTPMNTLPGRPESTFPPSEPTQSQQPVSVYGTFDYPQPCFNAVPPDVLYPTHGSALGSDAYSAVYGQMWECGQGNALQYPAFNFRDTNGEAQLAVGGGFGGLPIHHQFGSVPTPMDPSAQYSGGPCQLYEPEVPFQFPDHKPILWKRPDSPLGHIQRGFTGHRSGVGGGAPT